MIPPTLVFKLLLLVSSLEFLSRKFADFSIVTKRVSSAPHPECEILQEYVPCPDDHPLLAPRFKSLSDSRGTRDDREQPSSRKTVGKSLVIQTGCLSVYEPLNLSFRPGSSLSICEDSSFPPKTINGQSFSTSWSCLGRVGVSSPWNFNLLRSVPFRSICQRNVVAV